MKSEYKILIIAGEASADLLSSLLVKELDKWGPKIQWIGVGGQHLIKVGLKTIVEAKQISVVGLTDWLGRANEVFGGYFKVKKYVEENDFDLAILVDLPDFNLKIAKALKLKNVPTYYYAPPQVWASRQYRVRKIKKYFSKVFAILPFEHAFFEKHQVETIFIGHPLLDILENKKEYRSQEDIIRSPKIAILPGSRISEIKHHAEVGLEVLRSIRKEIPSAQFVLPVAPTLEKSLVSQYFNDPALTITAESAYKVILDCDVALVASGTATLETSLMGSPHCIFYKTNRVSTFIARKIFKYRNFFGIVNLLFGKESVKEFCLENCQSDLISKEVLKLIKDESYRTQMQGDLLKVRKMLGDKGAAEKAAKIIASDLSKI